MTASDSRITTPDRLIGLDAARLFATLGVIWFHSIESEELHASGVLGRSSVGFYTLAAMLFLVQSAARRARPVGVFTLDRLRRLGIPFVGWSLITFAVTYSINAAGYHIDLPHWSTTLLVDGGTIHLWYLPFLFIASVGAYPFALWMRGNRARQLLVACACVALALALDLASFDKIPILTFPTSPALTRFSDATQDRWSAVYWGITASILWSAGLNRSRWRIPLAVAGAILLIATTVWQWQNHLVGPLKTYAGLGLLAVSLAPWHQHWIRAIAPYGRMSAGMYFAHMAAIYTVRYLLMCIQFPHGPWRDAIVFVGAAILSFVVIALMAATPLRWLTGMDTAPSSSPAPRLSQVTPEDR
jgi:hypothetical protein